MHGSGRRPRAKQSSRLRVRRQVRCRQSMRAPTLRITHSTDFISESTRQTREDQADRQTLLAFVHSEPIRPGMGLDVELPLTSFYKGSFAIGKSPALEKCIIWRLVTYSPAMLTDVA